MPGRALARKFAAILVAQTEDRERRERAAQARAKRDAPAPNAPA